MWTHDDDKRNAVARLWRAVMFAQSSDEFDLEEREHLHEIMRMIGQNVPAECFAGFGDFKGDES